MFLLRLIRAYLAFNVGFVFCYIVTTELEWIELNRVVSSTVFALLLLFTVGKKVLLKNQQQQEEEEQEKEVEEGNDGATLPLVGEISASTTTTTTTTTTISNNHDLDDTTTATTTSQSRLEKKLNQAQKDAITTLISKLKNDATFVPNHVSNDLTYANAYRFLSARDYHMQKSEQLWRDAVKFRVDYRMQEKRDRIKRLKPFEDVRHDFVQKHWSFWVNHSLSKVGTPIAFFRPSTSDPAGIIRELGGNLDVFKDYYLNVVEECMEIMAASDRLDIGYIEINDMRFDASVPHYMTRGMHSVHGFIPLAKILNECYPQRVFQVYIMGAPNIFSTIWKFVQGLIPKETKKKLFFYSNKQMNDFYSQVGKVVDMETSLPQFIGGKASNENVLFGDYVPVGAFAEFEAQWLKDKQQHVKVGLIADVQYCTKEDGLNFNKTKLRKYQRSLELGLRRAIHDFNKHEVHFSVNLGDIVDGFATQHDKEKHESFRTINAELQKLHRPIHHLIGNHELYNVSSLDDARKELNQLLYHHPDTEQKTVAFRALECGGNRFRFIFLDSYDEAIVGREKTHPKHLRALQVLQQNNENYAAGSNDWLRELYGTARRFVPYNGGISEEQLSFLQQNLNLAKEKKQLVCVFSHVPFKPGCGPSSCLVFNYESVLSILQPFAHSNFNGEFGVVACMFGHAHMGGYGMDEFGIHYVTLPAPLESANSVSHGCAILSNHYLKITGFGAMPNYDLRIFKSQQQAMEGFERFKKKDVAFFHRLCCLDGGNEEGEVDNGTENKKKQNKSVISLAECQAIWEKEKGAWDFLKDFPKRYDD